jgi:hypothetical protein
MGNKCICRLETKSTVVTLEILKDHYTHTHIHTHTHTLTQCFSTAGPREVLLEFVILVF